MYNIQLQYVSMHTATNPVGLVAKCYIQLQYN